MRSYGTINLLQLQESLYSIDHGMKAVLNNYIKDLTTEDGNLTTLNVFQHTFGIKTHFLQYLGLLNAIPASWKKTLKNNYKENETNDCENNIIDIQNISSKLLRNILTKKLFEKPTSVAKLEKAGFTADEISYIYELPFKLTLDVRLSVFQFKINHNIMYTKSRLFRDKITDNDKCYLCSGSQTLAHLFVDCDFSKVFWIDFTSWWNCKTTCKLSSIRVIFYLLFIPENSPF